MILKALENPTNPAIIPSKLSPWALDAVDSCLLSFSAQHFACVSGALTQKTSLTWLFKIPQPTNRVIEWPRPGLETLTLPSNAY